MTELSLQDQGWSGTMDTTAATPTIGMVPFSNDWWLRRLNRRLDRRGERMRRYVDYYDGRHVIKLVSERFRDEFAKRFPEYSDNFMPLVVDTESNRLHVQGVRYGADRDSDPEAWAWWQDNHLDADAALAHKDALLKGTCNLLVWADPGGEPKVTIEDALQTVVDTVPGRRWERRAALKRWLDDDGRMLAELYLPDKPGLPAAVWRYKTRDKWGSTPVWEPTEWDGADRIDNPLGIVPIVPMVNRPSLSRLVSGTLTDNDDGESELASVISNQDHINAYRMMAMVSSEFASFRQRYALNLDVPKDPLTNRPKAPWQAGADHIIVIPPPDPEEYPDATKAPKVEVGEFAQTDVSGLIDLIRDELRRLATKAQMPYHFLLESQTVPPSGESIKSAEASFVMKVNDAQVNFGEAWEEAFRLNFLWRGDSRGSITGAEVFWRTPESRAEAVLTDAMVKAKSFGVADELLWEKWGLSPAEIARNKELMAEQPPTTGAEATSSPRTTRFQYDDQGRILAAREGPAE